MHFFIETDNLEPQTEGQSYGPIAGAESTKFRYGGLHTISAEAKAFAVTSGQLLALPINDDLLTLVLKPLRPVKDVPYVKYFIYRGIRKSSLVDSPSGQIASRTKNDLTHAIWSCVDALSSSIDKAGEQGSNIETSQVILGLGIHPENMERLKEFFGLSDSTFPVVQEGWHIGDYAKGEISFEIVLEHLSSPLLSSLQQVDPVLEIDNNNVGADEATQFKTRHKADHVLFSLDPGAFFGAYDGAIQVFNNGAKIDLDREAVYAQILSKYKSQNRIYIYLHDEFDRSFDLDGSYPSILRLTVGPGSPSIDLHTRIFGWPFVIFEPGQLDPSHLSGNTIPVGLSLSTESNTRPFLYFANTPQQKDEKRFVASEFVRLTPAEGDFTYPLILNLPTMKLEDDTYTLRADVIIAKYGRGFDLAVPLDTKIQAKTCRRGLLDVLFRLDGRLKLNLNDKFISVCHSKTLVDDPTRMPGAVAMSVGMAVDSECVAFIAFPSAIESRQGYGSSLAFMEEYHFKANSILEELEYNANMVLVHRSMNISGASFNYLVPEMLGDGPQANIFDFEVSDLQMLVISRREFEVLARLANTGMLDQKLPIYLGVDVTSNSSTSTETIHLSIRGYDTSSGIPQFTTVDSEIIILSPKVAV